MIGWCEGRTALQKAGLEVLDVDHITQSHQQAGEHARELTHRRRGVGGLHRPWSYASAIVAAAIESHLPVILWTPYRDDTGGIIGASIARGALAEVGIDAPLVHGNFDDQAQSGSVTKLAKYAPATHTPAPHDLRCMWRTLDGHVYCADRPYRLAHPIRYRSGCL